MEKKEISLKELKKIQVEILNDFTSFCEKNNLKYWLDSGTLLGAVRHKGYIPWDDDIDVGMLREDYDKALKLYNKNNPRYKLYSYENNKDFLYASAKVLDTQTLLYEPDENGNKLSVNIDVFVFDKCPNNPRIINKLFKKRMLCLVLQSIRINHNFKGKKFKFTRRFLQLFLNLFFPKDYFIKKIVDISKTYSDSDYEYVGNFTSYGDVGGPISIFDSFVDVSFEGKKYKAPIGYKEWLTIFYGDYMKLPPVEERKSHHTFKAYYLDLYDEK